MNPCDPASALGASQGKNSALGPRKACIVWGLRDPKRKSVFIMRRTLSGLLLVLLLFATAALAKHQKDQREQKEQSGQLQPLFMAPGFDFSQVDTICVAPAIDARTDTTQPLDLGPRQSKRMLIGGAHESADSAVSRLLNMKEFKTLSCNAVSATLAELKAPSDEFLRKLDFGSSRWLFIFAIEYLSTPYQKSAFGSDVGRSHAVVSGYLFEKQAAGNRLVWRDKEIGGDACCNSTSTVWRGNIDKLKVIASDQAIEWGALGLMVSFPPKGTNVRRNTHTEIVDTSCDLLWTALIDTLKNSGHYNVVQVDKSDMLAGVRHTR